MDTKLLKFVYKNAHRLVELYADYLLSQIEAASIREAECFMEWVEREHERAVEGMTDYEI